MDHRHATGPFDIIGDLHACVDELGDLLTTLGYEQRASGWRSPAGRTAVFVGDFVDRGPANIGTLETVMQMVDAGAALAVPGNHDLQLARHLGYADVALVHGLAETVEELNGASAGFRAQVLEFLEQLPGHLLLDGGQLVVAHTGVPSRLHGVDTDDARQIAVYGSLDGAMDPHDPEKRHPWVATHQGPPVVYGHTPVLEATWRNLSIDIDTGCVFGWKLTALRWPERDLVAIRSRQVYATRTRPFLPT